MGVELKHFCLGPPRNLPGTAYGAKQFSIAKSSAQDTAPVSISPFRVRLVPRQHPGGWRGRRYSYGTQVTGALTEHARLSLCLLCLSCVSRPRVSSRPHRSQAQGLGRHREQASARDKGRGWIRRDDVTPARDSVSRPSCEFHLYR